MGLKLSIALADIGAGLAGACEGDFGLEPLVQVGRGGGSRTGADRDAATFAMLPSQPVAKGLGKRRRPNGSSTSTIFLLVTAVGLRFDEMHQ